MKKLYVLCVVTLTAVLLDIAFFHVRPVHAQVVSGVRIDRVHFGTNLASGVANNALGHIVGFQCQALGGGDAECFIASTSN
jgi:hypothetical protein